MGILDLFSRLGCIQFDPINIVGRNPDLVLQARISNYRPEMLADLLYSSHTLVEGFDKVGSIFQAADWPYFERRRTRVRELHLQGNSAPVKHAWQIVELMRSSGRDSSHLPRNLESVMWDWGKPVRLDRAALDLLNNAGIVTIVSRGGNRKTYDLVERVLPETTRLAPDPNFSPDDYLRWHLLRRIGGLGLAQLGSSEFWGGILGMKTPERRKTVEYLVQTGELLIVQVDGIEKIPFHIRACDEDTLLKSKRLSRAHSRMTFLPPLDNLLWDRKLINALFGFEYLWEIYKKPAQRKYGHYTLPVLYGDRFVARCEFNFDRSKKVLTVPAWWWEEDVTPDNLMRKAAKDALEDFSGYLGGIEINMTIPGKI
jgi:uncharacterized protein YcaQ